MKKIFISYTHDSEEFKEKVKNFADLLHSNEIDCDLDQYIVFPVEGWTKWMIDRITESNFVLIVCSENYKVKAEDNTSQPSGGTWEGSIVRRDLYSTGNINKKFIPICFGPENRKFAPNFLADYTCFDIENHSEIELLLDLIKKDLFSRKPDQIAQIPKIDLNNLEEQKEKGTTNQFLIIPQNGINCILNYEQIIYDKTLEINLFITDNNESSFLLDLKNNKNNIILTYKLSSYSVNLVDCIQRIEQGKEYFKLIFEVHDYSKYAVITDIGLRGYTTEEIAEIRVKRILLNQLFPNQNELDFNRILEDTIFSGVGTPMKANKSLIPEILKRAKTFEEFKINAQLYCVTLLIHSVAVTRINLLTFSKEGNEIIVDFEGVRDKKYTNIKPQVIKFREPISIN